MPKKLLQRTVNGTKWGPNQLVTFLKSTLVERIEKVFKTDQFYPNNGKKLTGTRKNSIDKDKKKITKCVSYQTGLVSHPLVQYHKKSSYLAALFLFTLLIVYF